MSFRVGSITIGSSAKHRKLVGDVIGSSTQGILPGI